MSERNTIDFDALRRRLETHEGPTHWSSLEDLAQTPEFERWASAEFPSAWDDARGSDVRRREFLKLMGASFGLAGLSSACVKQPEEVIVPYVKQPEELIPGKPVHYATAIERMGYGVGVLVETHMFRPTHLAGNPDHPYSRGAMDPAMQASVLDVWDPNRSRAVQERGKAAGWAQFVEAMQQTMIRLRSKGGAGLRILTEPTSSGLLSAQIDALLEANPEARWHQYAPWTRWNAYAGAERAFGRRLEVTYDLAKARVVLAVDADFMGAMPGNVRHQRDLMTRRNRFETPDGWGRVYVAEAMPTVGGSAADHRIPIRASRAGALLAAVARELGIDVPRADAGVSADTVRQVAADLRRGGADSVVMVGDEQPPEVHALAHAVNDRLGAIGKGVRLTEPVLHAPVDPVASLEELTEDLRAGKVEMLLALGCNPVFDAPADLDFEAAYQKAKLRVHVGHHIDETAMWSHWHVPHSHYLETWSDVRALDGTRSVVQPVMRPLHGSKSYHEVVNLLADDGAGSDYARLRAHLKKTVETENFELTWRKSLHDGVIEGTAATPVKPALRPEATAGVSSPSMAEVEAKFAPDPNFFDGRRANNGWLMELPRPVTKITWDNAVFMSPSQAQALGVESSQVVEVSVGERAVRGPAWIVPGHADGAVTLHFGWGRRKTGRVAEGVGFDVFPLRTKNASAFASVSITTTSERHPIACTQDHFRMEDRGLIREATLAEYAANPKFAKAREAHMPKLTLWEPYQYKGYKWGMSINLSSCTGCNACVVACQSENNISVVGKDQVLLGREMHWLRIDRYYSGSLDNPGISNQPVLCMMCENAPCETVCPVNATVHGPEGLNQMVYNRCVGTRYCSNNCPYKVRRFNFYLYTDWSTETLKAQRNPDVTPRSRGVMEKCTYCVQRINEAQIQSTTRGEEGLETDVVRTACQEACPSDAIVFGDLNDPESQVAQTVAQSVNYTLLDELNTKPRTSYMARLTNPNPNLRPAPVDPGQHEASANEH